MFIYTYINIYIYIYVCIHFCGIYVLYLFVIAKYCFCYCQCPCGRWPVGPLADTAGGTCWWCTYLWPCPWGMHSKRQGMHSKRLLPSKPRSSEQKKQDHSKFEICVKI